MSIRDPNGMEGLLWFGIPLLRWALDIQTVMHPTMDYSTLTVDIVLVLSQVDVYGGYDARLSGLGKNSPFVQ